MRAIREQPILPVRLRWVDRDTMPALFPLAVAGLVAGALFAFVGMPDLPFMHPMFRFGIVVPTCGLTRGVVALVRRDPALAWAYNPASFLVVMGWVRLVIRGAVGCLHSRWLGVAVRWHTAAPLAVILAVALWINQQHHADFVIHGRL